MEEINQYREELEHRIREKPIWEKDVLNLKEASEYSGIGISKLRKLCNEKGCTFSIWNGNTIHIVRKKLDKFVEKKTRI